MRSIANYGAGPALSPRMTSTHPPDLCLLLGFIMRKNTTNRLIDDLKPDVTDCFIRDDWIRGFGLKVSPAGKVSFIAEGRIRSRSKARRINVGTHPALSVAQKQELAVQQLFIMQQGIDPVVALQQAREHEQSLSQSLENIFEAFLEPENTKDTSEPNQHRKASLRGLDRPTNQKHLSKRCSGSL
jgi:hypothetical protein